MASHFFGVGFFIDAALIAIGLLFLGWAIFKAVRDLWKCFELVKDATSLEELDLAAVMLGKVLATLGFETLLAVVSYGVLKLAKPAANAVRKGADAIGDWRKARRAADTPLGDPMVVPMVKDKVQQPRLIAATNRTKRPLRLDKRAVFTDICKQLFDDGDMNSHVYY